ncbi:hypothetical protein N7517_000413 [Penicillium concentricum]|uniref:Uncharacterized protein n=1 Tax=Penicillium concentricum TaxID=293559 RepID=A0A9W9SQ91_9EURO|nr:uncharacterized protein N7517_000413 [Penicillium concentricum]KAJ5382502.1 hypothetical protein N7517_000413 [Penicillium concentricum]
MTEGLRWGGQAYLLQQLGRENPLMQCTLLPKEGLRRACVCIALEGRLTWAVVNMHAVPSPRLPHYATGDDRINPKRQGTVMAGIKRVPLHDVKADARDPILRDE